MKVLELLENDEWTSNSTTPTLQYYWKKQLAATHAFVVEIHTLLKTHPDDDNLKALSRWTSFANQTSLRISNNVNLDGLGFPTLERRFDKMVDAKYEYEQAGGKQADGRYDPTAPWEEMS